MHIYIYIYRERERSTSMPSIGHSVGALGPWNLISWCVCCLFPMFSCYEHYVSEVWFNLSNSPTSQESIPRGTLGPWNLISSPQETSMAGRSKEHSYRNKVLTDSRSMAIAAPMQSWKLYNSSSCEHWPPHAESPKYIM